MPSLRFTQGEAQALLVWLQLAEAGAAVVGVSRALATRAIGEASARAGRLARHLSEQKT